MIYWTVLPLLLLHITGLAGQNSFTADPDDIGDTGCLPKLADPCFAGVYRNLECHLDPRAPYDCDRLDANDLCSAIEASLDCASDVIDNDCSITEGRDKFDSWVKGLRAMENSLCSGNKELLKVLIQDPQCWNSLQFLTCVERATRVTHVVDFLKFDLDLQTCNHLLIASATCNVRATKANQACEPPQSVIRELIQTFFSQSSCGSACYSITASSKSSATSVGVFWATTVFQAVLAIALQ